MGRLDATTRAEYDALTGYIERAALVRSALSGEVTATVLDGAENVRAVGTMADPWVTVVDNKLAIGQLASFAVTDGGTPDANWVLRFEGGGRMVEGSFGLSGAEFNWSLPTFETGQLGAIGTAEVIVAGREPVLRDLSAVWSTVTSVTQSRSVSWNIAAPSSAPLTIQVSTLNQLYAAVDTANGRGGAPTEIVLANGTYTLNSVALHITADNTTIRSAAGDRTQVTIRGDAMSDGATIKLGIWVQAHNCVLEDLTVERVGWHCVKVDGEFGLTGFRMSRCRLRDAYQQLLKVTTVSSTDTSVYSTGGVVEDSEFEYTAGIGPQFYIGGIDAHAVRNWIVRRNTFRNIASPSGSVAEHAIHLWNNAQDNLVERNKVINCDRGIGFGNGDRGTVGGTIRNNMVYHADNGYPFADVGIDLQTAPGAQVYHNTVFFQNTYPNAIEYRFSATVGVAIRNNLANRAIQARDGATGTVNSNATNAQSAWFVSASTGDPRLSASRAGVVDAGAVIASVTDDFDGDARPAGSGYDIGADEFLQVVSLAWQSLPSLSMARGGSINLSQYVAYNGSGTLTYSLVSGSLPSGVSLIGSTSVLTASIGAALGTVGGLVFRVTDGTLQADTSPISLSVTSASSPVLLQQSNLTYRGAFRLPNMSSVLDADSAAYCGEGLAFRPGGSLFVSGHEYYFKVGEISIPTPVISGSLSALPRASWIQGLVSLDKGFTGQLGDVAISNAKRSGGLLVYDNELWMNFYAFYDGNGDQRYSLTKGPLTLSNASRVGVYRFAHSGPVTVGTSAATNRYLGKIPAQWQGAFGGPAFAGGSTGFSSIAAIQSNGPAFSVWNPASLSGTAHKATVSAQQALAYGVNNPLRPPAQQSSQWNFTSSPAGAVFPAGSRSVLFFGTHGTGAYSYPPDAPPYRQYVWAYDANDLVAGISSSNKHTIQPYGFWDISSLFPGYWIGKWSIRGVDIDPDTNRIYVYCRDQDGVYPLVHVFDVVM